MAECSTYNPTVQIGRFEFNFKCLQKMICIMPQKEFVFSSDSLYDGLMMVYRASSDETKEQLKSILQLPIHLGAEFWALDRIVENRKVKGQTQEHVDKNVYCKNHSCWIQDIKCYKKNKYITPEKCRLFNRSEIHNIMNHINEELNEMQIYIPQPVVFRTFTDNMDFILSNELRFNIRPMCEKVTTYISRKFGMFVTKIFLSYRTSLFTLFPAVQELSKPNIWKIDEDISGLVERLATKEGAEMLREILSPKVSLEELPDKITIYPDYFELEHELPIDQLVEMLDIKRVLSPEKASLFGFTQENLHLGGANHRAYIKFTSKDVTANAINIFYTEYGGSLSSFQENNNCTQYKNSFVWMLHDHNKQRILFTGVAIKNC
ncbi:uncharacterized protein LOC114930262 isoform X1 [Nylanderia fulva]|uniref:uncharacterized protein LOC114930262 isoform X1 n=2 Tax=Nylanderia fulva TaxID=613905 RepID=UPI0010FAF1D9|nr:uncharacterized protein LOC114930262 isoform X1 [Nylanderia fulva]